ncbi:MULTISPECIES: hypothetical protein [unclassified Bradyrhizobium]|uniref:hypothetical protein n=1 Tax=unclassified Bradyrhizobium TaxID=2631580 RepID=UPI00047FF461|nr:MULTISPECIES: hypothetical protein [unclassified Bradyrhizobium]MCP3465651.1 hypothetical protein [Bradyrhizobium sp. CCGUVB23]
MANSVKFIRRLAKNIDRTPKDKGLELTIKVVMYDNGMVSVNGAGFRDGRLYVNPMLGASRQILQLLEELALQAAKRTGKRAAITRRRNRNYPANSRRASKAARTRATA